MVALQLIVALVVLLTSDGVQPQGNVQCAYEDKEFCYHVRRAYLSNDDAKKQLRRKNYYEDVVALLEIDAALNLILKRTDKAELFELTVHALKKEAEELIHLNKSCAARGWEYECFVAAYRLVEATVELVKALQKVAEGEALRIATEALAKYKDAESDSTQDIVALGIDLGSSVSEEIYRKRLIKITPKSQQ